MKRPGQTIWDTRVQGVTGLLCAPTEYGPEVYASATFALISDSPPRVAVNPNRAYAISDAIERVGRFSINVMSYRQRAVVQRLVRMRRREPRKAALLGLEVAADEHDVPFIPAAQRTLFCQVEQRHENGDRFIYVARVLSARSNPERADERPLLFSELSETPGLGRTVRNAVAALGFADAARAVLQRLRPRKPQSIRDVTYAIAGATAEELHRIQQAGLTDFSRRLPTPKPPAEIDRSLNVCVVGTSWGFEHCRAVRAAHRGARLYVCGRDPARTARVAQAAKADGYFIGLEAALRDPRIEAVCLALPHDQHRSATEAALAAGKHVLVEKPIAVALEDADAMIAAAQRSGKTLMVAENMHFRPAVHTAVERINAGDIGEPLYLLVHAGGLLRPQGWKQDAKRMGGGVIMDIGVHYVRALRMVLGDPDQVFASRAMQVNARMEGEDSAQLVFSSGAGWQAHMLLSWASQRGMLPDLVVAGTAGTLATWPARRYIEYYPAAPSLGTRLAQRVRPYWLQAKLMRPQWQRQRLPITSRHRSAYVAQMHEFLSAVAQQRAPATTAGDARRDLEIVLKAYESLESGTPTVIASAKA
ncbi:MAG: Gfo/Idh/MocA family oxidoreductase [Pirellulales bacterium]|nr:Gfo/Idh/MocA family oxidoreductase [Pirellulales bacterium]